MQTEDGEDDARLSSRFGVWPTIMGVVVAALLIWFMFAFADGFA